jgi:hypothetical protein
LFEPPKSQNQAYLTAVKSSDHKTVDLWRPLSV